MRDGVFLSAFKLGLASFRWTNSLAKASQSASTRWLYNTTSALMGHILRLALIYHFWAPGDVGAGATSLLQIYFYSFFSRPLFLQTFSPQTTTLSSLKNDPSLPKQPEKEQQEVRDETIWNSHDCQNSFEAPLSALKEPHQPELFWMKTMILKSHLF